MARLNKLFKESTGAENVKLTAGAETVVATVTGVYTDVNNTRVELQVEVPMTTAASSTEQVVRIRRESLTGTEVAKTTVKEGESKKCTVSLLASDVPGEVAGMSYVVTLEDVAKHETEAHFAVIQAIY